MVGYINFCNREILAKFSIIACSGVSFYRAETRALIMAGGGGVGLCEYSYIRVLPNEISFEISCF